MEAPGRQQNSGQQNNRNTTSCVTGRTNLTDVHRKRVLGQRLGLAVTVGLSLEGEHVKALVVTESPMTIVSIACWLDILTKNQKTGQTKGGRRRRDSLQPLCRLTTMVAVR